MTQERDFQPSHLPAFSSSRRALLGAGAMLVAGTHAKLIGRRVATEALPRHTLSLGPAIRTGWAKCDTNPGIDHDGNGLTWLILGTTDWSIYSTRTVDGLKPERAVKPNFARPHGDDAYWPSGLWIDPHDQRWYCPVHCEYHYGRYSRVQPTSGWWSPDHRRRMVLATSIDQGRSWSLAGDILTGAGPDDPSGYPGDYYQKGVGDAHLFVDDDYFYAFYRTGWYRKSTQTFYETIRAARSPRRSRMAPGSWRKWYRGGWSEPGLGGLDSDVFNPGSGDTAYVFYSVVLGRYVALIGGGDRDNPQGYIATARNLQRQDWTVPIWFADAKTHGWYNWGMDPRTLSRHRMEGDWFHYFTAENDEPIRRKAQFVRPGTTPLTNPPAYPPEPVPDGNPGWDGRWR